MMPPQRRRSHNPLKPSEPEWGASLTDAERADPATKGEVAEIAALRKRVTDYALQRVATILAILIACTLGLAAIVYVTRHATINENSHRISEINLGRAQGSKVSCGLNTAQIKTNLFVLKGGAQHYTPQQERELERLGFGNKAQREAQAAKLAADYLEGIRNQIEASVGKGTNAGRVARSVIRNDGSVDCGNLLAIAKVPGAALKPTAH